VGKISSKVINVAVATVAIEDELTSVSLDVKQETPDVSALSDAGPRRVVGNYDFSLSGEGAADFAAGQGDATLFSLVGASAAKAVGFDPTGAATAGTSDPHYDATDMLLDSYSIKGAVGAGVTYSFSLQGNSALARATS
jgi:hypothetical protein